MKPFLPPPVIGIIIGFAMWIVAYQLPQFSFMFAGKSLIGGIFIVVGFGIDLISVLRFAKSKTTISPLVPERTKILVVEGLYQYSRNPMYLGMLLILIGWSVILGNIIGFFFPILFFVMINELQI